jgi:hypothetical protein
MTTFKEAVIEQETTTENGMVSYKSTTSPVVDLFFSISAMRGKDIIPAFVGGYLDDPDKAIRIALWSRDVRSGAGEREIFRQILRFLAINHRFAAVKLIPKIPELGRWDDLFAFENTSVECEAFDYIKQELLNNNGSNLVAKWMPRRGPLAVKLRNYFGWSPKFYRKRLVERSNGLTSCDQLKTKDYRIVESKMCNKQWDSIKFEHVPSLAHARYKKAFIRNAGDVYTDYVTKLVTGEVKINAGAVYPYDILKGLMPVSMFNPSVPECSSEELAVITAQWQALPNYLAGQRILPMIDVSGSMQCPIGNNINSSISCLQVAVSLGLYIADKNVGGFKDTFLTFSGEPELLVLRGDIVEKIQQIISSHWQMNTDLNKAIDLILSVAIANKVPQSEMPEVLIIFSDMQFDQDWESEGTAQEMLKEKYREAGYRYPKVIYWNLNHRKGNIPVRFNESGTGLVSGFSPSLLKSILGCKDINPYSIMDTTIMVDRYKWFQ